MSVAQRFLEDVETGGRPEVRDNIAYHIAEVHTSVGQASLDFLKRERRFNYTTPKSFLELISFYKQLLKARRDEMFANIKRLDTGLEVFTGSICFCSRVRNIAVLFSSIDINAHES